MRPKLFKYFKLDYFNDRFVIFLFASHFKNNFRKKFISHRSHQILKFILFRFAFIHFLPHWSVLSRQNVAVFAPRFISPPNNEKLQLSFNLFFYRRVLFSICLFTAKRNHRGVQKLLNAIPNWTFNKCPIMCWVECLANVLMAQIKFIYRFFLFVFNSRYIIQ